MRIFGEMWPGMTALHRKMWHIHKETITTLPSVMWSVKHKNWLGKIVAAVNQLHLFGGGFKNAGAKKKDIYSLWTAIAVSWFQQSWTLITICGHQRLMGKLKLLQKTTDNLLRIVYNVFLNSFCSQFDFGALQFSIQFD